MWKFIEGIGWVITTAWNWSVGHVSPWKFGSNRGDYIVGGHIANYIYGYGGNDTLIGFGQYSRLDGGDGDDRLYGYSVANVQLGGKGNDYMVAYGMASNRQWGGEGDDYAYAVGSSNYQDGGTGNDKLISIGAYSRQYGGEGSDYLYARGAANRQWGGSGNDELYGEGAYNQQEGGSGNDWLKGVGTVSKQWGGDGSDYIQAWDGTYAYQSGGSGDDTLNAWTTSVKQEGGTGNDYLWGNGSWVSQKGEDGNDTLISQFKAGVFSAAYGGTYNQAQQDGGSGNDYMEAQDFMVIGQDGGSGNDRMYAYSAGKIFGLMSTIRQSGGDGNDQMGSYYSVISGQDGGAGDDTIRSMKTSMLSIQSGGGGNDKLYSDQNLFSVQGGGDGHDLFYSRNTTATAQHGGAGKDTMSISEGLFAMQDGGVDDDNLYTGGASALTSLSYQDGGVGNDFVYTTTNLIAAQKGGHGDDRLLSRKTRISGQYGGDGDDELDAWRVVAFKQEGGRGHDSLKATFQTDANIWKDAVDPAQKMAELIRSYTQVGFDSGTRRWVWDRDKITTSSLPTTYLVDALTDSALRSVTSSGYESYETTSKVAIEMGRIALSMGAAGSQYGDEGYDKLMIESSTASVTYQSGGTEGDYISFIGRIEDNASPHSGTTIVIQDGEADDDEIKAVLEINAQPETEATAQDGVQTTDMLFKSTMLGTEITEKANEDILSGKGQIRGVIIQKAGLFDGYETENVLDAQTRGNVITLQQGKWGVDLISYTGGPGGFVAQDGGNNNDILRANGVDTHALQMGGLGNDALITEGANSIQNGGMGDDIIIKTNPEGSVSAGMMIGGEGNDYLANSGGKEIMAGGNGNDRLAIDVSQAALATGGNGDDLILVKGKSRDTKIVATGGLGNDVLIDTNNGLKELVFNTILGGGPSGAIASVVNDIVSPSRALIGGGGNDIVIGGAGSIAFGDLDIIDDTIDKLESHLPTATEVRTSFESAVTEGTEKLIQELKVKADAIVSSDGVGEKLSILQELEGSFEDIETIEKIIDESGTEGNDVLLGSGVTSSVLFGGAGRDVFIAPGENWLGFDTVANFEFGGAGDDLLIAGGFMAYSSGGAGNDLLIAGEQYGYQMGGSGNDILIGGGDLYYNNGGEGEDVLVLNGDNNIFSGGSGRDLYIFDYGYSALGKTYWIRDNGSDPETGSRLNIVLDETRVASGFNINESLAFSRSESIDTSGLSVAGLSSLNIKLLAQVPEEETTIKITTFDSGFEDDFTLEVRSQNGELLETLDLKNVYGQISDSSSVHFEGSKVKTEGESGMPGALDLGELVTTLRSQKQQITDTLVGTSVSDAAGSVLYTAEVSLGAHKILAGVDDDYLHEAADYVTELDKQISDPVTGLIRETASEMLTNMDALSNSVASTYGEPSVEIIYGYESESVDTGSVMDGVTTTMAGNPDISPDTTSSTLSDSGTMLGAAATLLI